MRIFNGFEKVEEIPFPVLTIGTFDGVHIGHQKIIQKLNEEALKHGGESVLFTFYPHPKMVLFPDSHGIQLIQTQEEKLAKLNRFGLQNIINYPFTKDFSQLPAVDFVRDFLVNQLRVKTLVIGYDHHFGRNREGNIDLLKELSAVYNFEVIEISAKEIDEVKISSTKIRRAIEKGDISLANNYLGEAFELNGKVIHGKKIGTQLGFPTANLDLESEVKLIPKHGVYAAQVVRENGDTHFGLLSIGERPTVDDSGKLSTEVFLLDFNGNLYDEYLRVKLLRKIREDRKFENVEKLKQEMKNDEKILRHWLVQYNW